MASMLVVSGPLTSVGEPGILLYTGLRRHFLDRVRFVRLGL